MQSNYTPKDIERFWSKVDKEKSEIFYNGTRCWEWIGNCFPNDYGQISIGGRFGKKHLAHRMSYELSVGEIAGRLLVLHRCDNRKCVRPEHLFLGSHHDNTVDMRQKGRQGDNRPKAPARGENHGMAKLTDEQVVNIRSRYGRRGVGGETLLALANEFGVKFQTISDIVNYKYRK